ncbi:hypothetical protein Ga0102493_112987 [Erythrobacter litoralis]|uniref:Uncharacterized protein n=1 Tax=Erythrobacter litoralis TaxID=39960 RepID=A0A074N0Q8_9SPHN|nr:hypothetical protein [Erythrobacter litoralis]AOL23985.1 hypothetical protein Ga0102493_112987 [Erythrobacter litoralis]KEO98540.1 hypothetical protein EH32_05360 [Erythrobacter litoralis]
MIRSGFSLVDLDEKTVAALRVRAPQMPTEGFHYAVSRFIAPAENVTPKQVRDELGGKDSTSKLEGIPELAAQLQSALNKRGLAASELLTMNEHKHGVAGLTKRLERDLREFLDLCEMARREAAAAVRPGRKVDANTELVRDLARALRLEGAEPDASQAGPLVQAFDLAHRVARQKGLDCVAPADCADTVAKALRVLGKE